MVVVVMVVALWVVARVVEWREAVTSEGAMTALAVAVRAAAW
jgi:hypothetical protein